MLTRVDVPGVSGIQGVEWDAVELPRQFMENYCWEWDVLKHMTAHVATGDADAARAVRPNARGEELPERHGDRCGRSSSRCSTCCCTPTTTRRARALATPQALLDAVRARSGGRAARPTYDRFIHSFSHIFDGGYAAGYYSYKWAEVLSADAYSLFEEAGVLSPAAGAPLPRRGARAWRQPQRDGVVCRFPGPGTPTGRPSAA